MNKKLLAVAVSAAVLAPAFASADVTVYGRVQAEYNVEDANCNGCDSVQSVDDNAGMSRIGIKFTEKLGGGLTAFGKAEFRIDPADSTSNGTSGNASAANGGNPAVSGALGQRDIHAGIKGAWGSIAAGSFHAPYKTAGGVKWDPMVATHLQARRAGGMSGGAGVSGHNGFMRNAIYYTSPNLNGFKVQFAISPDETNHPRTGSDTDGADNDYSIAVQYKNGPWHAIFAHNRNNDPTFDEQTLTKIGLQWKSGAFTVAGQYEWVRDAMPGGFGGINAGGAPSLYGQRYEPGTGEDAEFLWLNGQYKMGNNIITASYGNMDADVPGAASDYEHDYWMIGVIHKFSKQTRIFGGYTETDGDNNATNASGQLDRDAWTVGIRKDF